MKSCWWQSSWINPNVLTASRGASLAGRCSSFGCWAEDDADGPDLGPAVRRLGTLAIFPIPLPAVLQDSATPLSPRLSALPRFCKRPSLPSSPACRLPGRKCKPWWLPRRCRHRLRAQKLLCQVPSFLAVWVEDCSLNDSSDKLARFHLIVELPRFKRSAAPKTWSFAMLCSASQRINSVYRPAILGNLKN